MATPGPGGWPRRLLRSTTTRFILLAFAFQLPVTGGVLFFVQQTSHRALIGELRDGVADLRADLIATHARGGTRALSALIEARVRIIRGDVPIILLVDRDGTPLAGNLGAWPTVIAADTPWRTITLYRSGSDQPELMGVSATTLRDGSRLLAGRVIDASVQLNRINEGAILAALLIGLALTLISAIVLGRILSRQIDGIVATTRAVRDGALGERVPVDGSGDAFDALGQSINAMLERIQSLVSQLRLMTDGLAHDLRSPITRIKSALERATADTRDPGALAALESVSTEAESLLAMLSTALLISRTEAGIGRDHFVDTDVARLFTDLAEVYGPAAEERGFTLATDVPPGLHARLHRQLASQAIGNLIDNALNYARGGNAITLAARRTTTGIELSVADNGCGIPPERHEEALRRFGRLDPARQVAGSGLGLTLVEAVAQLHGGHLTLADNAPGLRAVVSLVG